LELASLIPEVIQKVLELAFEIRNIKEALVKKLQSNSNLSKLQGIIVNQRPDPTKQSLPHLPMQKKKNRYSVPNHCGSFWSF